MTEPMYLISESELTELEIDSSEDTYGSTDGIEIAERIRARGPVQQAPEPPEICCKCEDTPDVCSSTQRKCEDAALIAQEREKWERELRVDAQNPWCYPGCILVDKAKAQAREDVLEPLEDLRKYANGEYKEAELSDNEREMRIHLEYENRIWGIMRSLRHGQGREPE